jgi:hemoglobin
VGRSLRRACFGGAILAVLACGTTPAPAPAPAPVAAAAEPAAPKSLYERLGGLPAIGAVVDEMLKNVAGDARIAHRFALTDLGGLRGKLIDQICQATGGPCTYQGGDMKTVHKGQRVSSADFTALVEDLKQALDHFKVPEREQSELLGALASMQGDIVEVP